MLRGRSLVGLAAALCVGGAAALAMAPAQAAAQTVAAQLTLSGVASPDSPTGGSVVGVHPGDSVKLTASLLPTAGAPAGLGDVLGGLLGSATGFQVRITSGNLPGVHYPYLLGKVNGCGGHASLPLRSLAKGTYTFHYTPYKASPATGLLGAVIGCHQSQINLDASQLAQLSRHNINVTDTSDYGGKIVAAANPPKGTIGIQVPKQSISASAGPIHTHVNLPGGNVGVPNNLPKLPKLPALPGLPGAGSGGSGGSKSGGGSVNYTPPPQTVPQRVMPKAVANGGTGSGSGSGGFAAPAADGGKGPGGTLVSQNGGTASKGARSAAHKGQPAGKAVDVAQPSRFGGPQLPVVLAIVSILALATVTGAYAKLYLSRHLR
jgi:hypothetical protein